MRRVWCGFGVVAAGAQLLAACGYPDHMLMARYAMPLLEEGGRALRAAASLPDNIEPVEVTVAGVAGPDLDPDWSMRFTGACMR